MLHVGAAPSGRAAPSHGRRVAQKRPPAPIIGEHAVSGETLLWRDAARTASAAGLSASTAEERTPRGSVDAWPDAWPDAWHGFGAPVTLSGQAQLDDRCRSLLLLLRGRPAGERGAPGRAVMRLARWGTCARERGKPRRSRLLAPTGLCRWRGAEWGACPRAALWFGVQMGTTRSQGRDGRRRSPRGGGAEPVTVMRREPTGRDHADRHARTSTARARLTGGAGGLGVELRESE